MPEIYHQIILEDTEKRWLVDCQAAADVMPWIKRTPQVLQTDLIGMHTYFPHWILVAGEQGKPRYCSCCAQFYVPRQGKIRCIQCQHSIKTKELLWLGHVPVLARPEVKFIKQQDHLRREGYDEISLAEETYLLVPLTVAYPSEWPNIEPVVRYGQTWLKTLGLPLNSARHHLISGGRACIFSWGQWRVMPIHTVLHQRMVNHIMSLFKIVAGQTPEEAFIGRIHHNNWQPQSQNESA